MITDNAFAYRKSTAVHAAPADQAATADLGIVQKFIRPWANGQVERFNHTLAAEWAYARPYDTNIARSLANLAQLLQHGTTPPRDRRPTPPSIESTTIRVRTTSAPRRSREKMTLGMSGLWQEV